MKSNLSIDWCTRLFSKCYRRIFKIPVLSSFNKGLNFFEYFISCYGGRKGILDTALKTADAGYLTRRLVESIQELNIKEYNCGSNNSFEYFPQINIKGNLILPFFITLWKNITKKFNRF